METYRCRGVTPGLVACLLVAVGLLIRPLAAASPADPIWIGGIYDDADFDDIVNHIGSLSSACDWWGTPAVTPSQLAGILRPAAHRIAPSDPSIALRNRAPPA